jgi:hypothetical protein
MLVLSNGEYAVVERVQHEILENTITVYNFEVEDFHTYFVGTTGMLVHNSCGMQNPNTRAAAERGRKMHNEYDYGGDFEREVYLGRGIGRADAVDFNNHIVYELKPNNARAIREGWKQLNRYVSELERQNGGDWIRILVTYD